MWGLVLIEHMRSGANRDLRHKREILNDDIINNSSKIRNMTGLVNRREYPSIRINISRRQLETDNTGKIIDRRWWTLPIHYIFEVWTVIGLVWSEHGSQDNQKHLIHTTTRPSSVWRKIDAPNWEFPVGGLLVVKKSFHHQKWNILNY